MILSKKPLIALLAGVGMLATGQAFADIAITVNGGSGNVGGTVTIDFDYAALDADDVGGFQFDLTYDPAALTPSNIADCGLNRPASHNASCTEPGGAGNGTVRTLIADFTPPTDEITPFNIANFGELTFTINQPGTHTLTFTNGVGGDITGANVPITGNDASITGAIVGNAGFASSPAPGATIALGESEVGTVSGLSPQNITVSEIGDQQLDITAITFAGPDAADFSTTVAPFSIADGGADAIVDVSCTPSSRGFLTATVELTNNSVNAPAPVYDLTCAGLSPNVVVPAGPVAINGLTIDPNPLTGTFDVTNPDDDFTSDALNVTAAAVGDAEITVAPAGPLTIATAGSQTFTASCDNTAAGNFTSTITITWDDPVSGGTLNDTIDVNCTVIDEVAEYESVPPAGSTLDFGAVLNGDTSAPLGVDIGNSNTDATPNADLTISAATITGPDAAVFTLLTDPTGDVIPAGQAPDGTDNAEVTCTPTDGFSTFTATLTISSNDPDGDATYPLTCDGDSDAALVSDPVPGTVSLGIIGPGGSADTTITLTNTGTTDDISLDSCTLTADPEITLVSPVAFPVAIAPGASTDIVLNCTPGSPGTFTGTLACEASDVQGTLIPLNYDLICSGQAVEVPTLSRLGLLAMIMALMAVGFIGFRLRQN
ncbi:MAG: choice-of-anchor D domain-containing protein [Gammaproteobacteria bacterium]|nr:choice-of-anchor D domain-containing protein [Gammaproteobacteria bacterium]